MENVFAKKVGKEKTAVYATALITALETDLAHLRESAFAKEPGKESTVQIKNAKKAVAKKEFAIKVNAIAHQAIQEKNAT